MENEDKIRIVDDFGADTITIYWMKRIGGVREEWFYIENGYFMVQTFERRNEGYAPSERKPFVVMPRNVGLVFLSLINSEIVKDGFNQRQQDMKAGKLELLETELSFSKQQLTKFIDHFTK